MSKLRNGGRIFAGGLVVALALGTAAPARADLGSNDTAAVPLPPAKPVVRVRRGVRVPAGILAGVPTGGSPGGVRLRTYFPPFPVGFAADPYYSPPAVVVVPPPILFAPPWPYDIAPVGLPFGWGCF